MNKIELANWNEIIDSIELLKTNYKTIFLSIQWESENRVIWVVVKNPQDQKPLEDLENTKDFKVPNWYSLIGIIWKWSFNFGNFTSAEHYYKKVNENFRWLWIWSLLFNVKEAINWIIDEEYSRKISSINFLLRNGFQIEQKIDIKWNQQEVTRDFESEIYEEISKYIETSKDYKIKDYALRFSRKLTKITK